MARNNNSILRWLASSKLQILYLLLACIVICLFVQLLLHSNLHFAVSSYFPNVVRKQSPTFDFRFFPRVFHSPQVFEKEFSEMLDKFRVFVYPEEDPNVVCRTPRKLHGKYASEGYFFKNIRQSEFLTSDPEKAHLFFIPISCHKLRGQGKSSDEITGTIQDYVKSLRMKYPYWNRTLGADHFFVTCHETGVTATANSFLMENTIRVVCSPGYDTSYIPRKDVSLPQMILPYSLHLNHRRKDFENRTVLGFWAGLRNSDIRDKLLQFWGNDEELDIQKSRVNKNSTGYLSFQEKFYNSKFCICPRGSAIHGGRIAEAIHYGCVPVIMSDYYDLPFNDILEWRKFALILREDLIDILKDILKDISDDTYRYLHTNLVEVYQHFTWNSPPVRLDAFYMVMYELWLRRHVIRYPVAKTHSAS